MYTFKNPDNNKLYAVLTNRIITDGITPVTVTLPSNIQSFKVKQTTVNCQGENCLWSNVVRDGKTWYGSDVYINGKQIKYLYDAARADTILQSVAPVDLDSSSNSLTISMENHSILFWEMDTVEKQVSVNQSKEDFNNDGKEDVLWRNEGTGQNVIWFMNGTSLHNYEFIDPESTSQKIVAAVDFNTDGSTDILWRDSTNGEMTIWLMNGKEVARKIKIETPSAPGTAFDFAGLGDLRGSNSEDIILRNKTTGENGIWYLNRTSFIAWDRFETAPVDMSIQTIADFNQDGKDDIVWRNNTTGDVSVWLMDYKNILHKTSLVANVPAEWVFMGKGDFNKDSSIDLYWRNTDTGDNGIWFMKKEVIDSRQVIRNQSADWYPAQFSDFNSDGYTDVLWRNKNNGAAKLWLMQNTSITQQLDLTTVPLEWSIQPRLSTIALISNPTLTPTATNTPTVTPLPTHTPTPTPTTPVTGTHITVRAYGTLCQGVYPTMILKIGTNEVKTWNNVGPSMSNYTFDSPQSYAGAITVHFTNDCYKPPEDRNLFVDYITINGTTIQSETQGVYNTGGYTEWLWRNGFIQYPLSHVLISTPTTLPPTVAPTLPYDPRDDSSECERRYGSGASCETAIDCIRSDGQVKDTFCDTGKFCCLYRR
jgi:hypothetical protein